MASQDDEFTMLFQDFYPSLCRFLECLLGGRAPLAQDLAQESFLQLHRTAWGTLPPGEARFWLYRGGAKPGDQRVSQVAHALPAV